MSPQARHQYGGQAVIEGVMIRGRSYFSLAVRRPDGSIWQGNERLNPFYAGRIRQVPLLRGTLVLVEMLLLGIKALHRSAGLAGRVNGSDPEEKLSGWVVGATLAVSLGLAVGPFFLLPLLVVRAMDQAIASALASNLVEGLLRLAILIGYVWAIGFLAGIKGVYAYHGAEHMVVHAYEAGLPLTLANVRRFRTPHPRCGTAFLLAVVLVSIVVFSLLGRPPLEWRILSRILLIPVIASLSYELIRFSGFHQGRPLGQLLAYPGLLLQRLTTREPDDGQVEIAICAMEGALAADAGRAYLPSFPPREPAAPGAATEEAIPPPVR